MASVYPSGRLEHKGSLTEANSLEVEYTTGKTRDYYRAREHQKTVFIGPDRCQELV